MNAHTPTPWHSNESDRQILRAESGRPVAEFALVEDANFVLRLSKSHDTLLAALKLYVSRGNLAPAYELGLIRDKARNAIAFATALGEAS